MGPVMELERARESLSFDGVGLSNPRLLSHRRLTLLSYQTASPLLSCCWRIGSLETPADREKMLACESLGLPSLWQR